MMDAYSEGSDLPAHLMKGICCGLNWPTTSIIHSPLGSNSMGCWDWSKLTIPLVQASFLSLQFSLVLIDIFVLYSKLWLVVAALAGTASVNNVTFPMEKWLQRPPLDPQPSLHCLLLQWVTDQWQWQQRSLLPSGAREPYWWAQGLLIQQKLFNPYQCCTEYGCSPGPFSSCPQENPMTPGVLSWVHGRAVRGNLLPFPQFSEEQIEAQNKTPPRMNSGR